MEKEVLYLLVGLGQAEGWSPDVICSFHVAGGDPTFGPSFPVFPGAGSGNWIRAGIART